MSAAAADAGKYIAVGDIHGCAAQLDELLGMLEPFSGHRLVFLGDYLSRGPDPEGVIRRLRGLDAVFLTGNHERMLLNAIGSARTAGDRKRILQLARISEDSLEWIESRLVLLHQTDSFIFVHAGLNPETAIDHQAEQDLLYSRQTGDFYALTEKTVIHGHTCVDEPEIVGNRININTYGGYGGPLTALVLPEMQLIRSSPTPGTKPADRLAELREEMAALFDELELLTGAGDKQAVEKMSSVRMQDRRERRSAV